MAAETPISFETVRDFANAGLDKPLSPQHEQDLKTLVDENGAVEIYGIASALFYEAQNFARRMKWRSKFPLSRFLQVRGNSFPEAVEGELAAIQALSDNVDEIY